MKYPGDEPILRFGRIKKEMEKRGFDALVIYSCQWKVEFLHYVANFRVLGKDACVVLPLNGDPIMYLSQAWDEQRAHEDSWIKNIVVAREGMLKLAGEQAAKCGGNIGLVGAELLPQHHRAALDDVLNGRKPDNAFDLLDGVAKVKTDWEIEILRECASFADIGFIAEVNCLYGGISECEVVAELDFAMKSAGADDNFQMIGMGTQLPSMNLPTDKTLKAGDLVLTEITPMKGCLTYATQLCKTVKFGAATKIEKEKYQLLCDALEYTLSQTKAGVPARKLSNWQNEIIGNAGYAKYCVPPYMRSRGHNFGLGLVEITDTTELILEENMVFVVHPNQMIPEIGYLACGETVRVTKDGVERLSKIPMSLIEVLPRL